MLGSRLYFSFRLSRGCSVRGGPENCSISQSLSLARWRKRAVARSVGFEAKEKQDRAVKRADEAWPDLPVLTGITLLSTYCCT